MSRGWYNHSRQHALAARGISTKVPQVTRVAQSDEPLKVAPPLPTQLYAGYGDPHHIPALRNENLPKPWGGRWVSSWNPETGSDWVQWTLDQVPDWFEERGTVCEIDPNARILLIENRQDLRNILEVYPGRMGFEGNQHIDYEKLAKDYDGIHVTKEGVNRVGGLYSTPNLDGWDVESTVLFRDVFRDCKSVNLEGYKRPSRYAIEDDDDD